MSKKLHAVFTIVDYSKAETVAHIYKEEKIPVAFGTHGHGSADSSMLELLGFGENRKGLMFTLLSPERKNYIFKKLDEKMHISKPGTGILFSIPVTSATAFLAGLIDKDTKKYLDDTANEIDATKERELPMANEHEHELIITIITKGYFPEVKAAANAAGARGGTLIHALGLGGEEAQKFLGIAIQPEKDVILIVVKKEEKNKVMQAISEAAGINTEGRGIIFSLPVDSALGLR